MTVLLFLLAVFWQVMVAVAGPLATESTRQDKDLAVVALSVRAVIPSADAAAPEPVVAAFGMPMFASFLPLVSYSTLLFVLAYVAARFRKWFRLRRRGPHYLEDDGEADVELLPTSTADVLPEFRDYAVPLPSIPSPPRLSRVDRFMVGRTPSHGRSASLSLPSASSAYSTQAALDTPFPSLPHRFHSTPNTPTPLVDISIPDGIHPRKPFVNELASDLNISPDTLFGMSRSPSNRSEDIAEMFLRMKSAAVAEPAPPSPVESHSSEQDVTLVQLDTDLIDFSPKKRALQLEAQLFERRAESPVHDIASASIIRVTEDEDARVDAPEMELLDFSKWDEESWGFEVVTPAGAQTKLASPDVDAHLVNHWDTEETSFVDDPFSDSHEVLVDELTRPVDAVALPEFSLSEADQSLEEENPFASPAVSPFDLHNQVDLAEVEHPSSVHLDSPAPQDTVLAADLESPHSENNLLLAEMSDTTSELPLAASSPLLEMEPALPQVPATSLLFVNDASLVEPEPEVHASSREHDVSDVQTPPAFPLEIEIDTTRPVSPATPTARSVCSEHSALPSPVEDDVPLPSSHDHDPPLASIHDLSYLSLSSSYDPPLPSSHDLARPSSHDLDDPDLIPAISIFIPDADPDYLPLPVPVTEQIPTPVKEQTPTPPDSPLLTPMRKVKPLWSLRASDAPALGLSASPSAATSVTSSPSDLEGRRELKTRLSVSLLKAAADVSEAKAAADESEVKAPVDVDVSEVNAPGDVDVSEVKTPVLEKTRALSTALPGSFDAPSLLEVEGESSSSSSSSAVPVQEKAVEKKTTRPRTARSPIDIALAMQLRPGLGLGADPAWMVRFLMSMFGWFVVLISGSGGEDGYHYPVRR